MKYKVGDKVKYRDCYGYLKVGTVIKREPQLFWYKYHIECHDRYVIYRYKENLYGLIE